MVRQLIDMSMRLEGLHRHAGKHAAGVVISDKPLQKRIPLFKTADDQITTGFSMKSLDEIGMLKMDFLGLKTLTVIDQTTKIVEPGVYSHRMTRFDRNCRKLKLGFSKV